jgi:hypothetical protein
MKTTTVAMAAVVPPAVELELQILIIQVSIRTAHQIWHINLCNRNNK